MRSCQSKAGLCTNIVYIYELLSELRQYHLCYSDSCFRKSFIMNLEWLAVRVWHIFLHFKKGRAESPRTSCPPPLIKAWLQNLPLKSTVNKWLEGAPLVVALKITPYNFIEWVICMFLLPWLALSHDEKNNVMGKVRALPRISIRRPRWRATSVIWR